MARVRMEDPSPQSAALTHSLVDAAKVIRGVGLDYRPAAAQLHELTERLAAGRFHLAILGQFKRGKSTLLNALLGEPVLPTVFIPAGSTRQTAGGSTTLA